MLPILLLDGGLGTTLESPPYNVRFTTETPLWSSHLLLSDPATLRAAQRAFFNAGAEILLTATYQTSLEGFARTAPGYTREDAMRFMRSAIPIAREAGPVSSSCLPSLGEGQGQGSAPGQGYVEGRTGRVALSLGPYGATMTPVAAEYTGLYPAEMDDERVLRDWHAERLRVFVGDDDNGESAGTDSNLDSWRKSVDYVAFETLRRTDEVRAVRGAMCDVVQNQGRDQMEKKKKKKKKKTPWWICGVFPAEEVDEGDVRRWVDAALGGRGGLPRPWGVGVNCTRIDHLGKIVSIMQDEVRILSESRRSEDGYVDEWGSVSGRPWLVLYPDGTKGERYDPATKTWVTTGESTAQRPWDEIYWDVVKNISDRDWEGIVMGGCCRAGPAEIAALRHRIDAGKQS